MQFSKLAKLVIVITWLNLNFYGLAICASKIKLLKSNSDSLRFDFAQSRATFGWTEALVYEKSNFCPKSTFLTNPTYIFVKFNPA